MVDSRGEHTGHEPMGEPARHDEPADTPLTGEEEPPPVGPWSAFNLYSSPVPFGAPPSEPIEIDGEVPWELRDDPSDDEKRDTAR